MPRLQELPVNGIVPKCFIHNGEVYQSFGILVSEKLGACHGIIGAQYHWQYLAAEQFKNNGNQQGSLGFTHISRSAMAPAGKEKAQR